MQANRLSAARGWHWILEGFALFRMHPTMLTFLVFGYWLMLASINAIPFLGAIVAPLCVPAFSMGVMNGCRAIDRGGQLDSRLLFSGFQTQLKRLILLGALYLIGSGLILVVTALVDQGALLKLILSNKMLTADHALPSPSMMFSVQFAMLLTLPMIMAFWFAPMLVAWHGLAPIKALFFSFVASWINWRAFLLYGLLLLLLGILVPSIILGLFAGGGGIIQWVVFLPILFILMPTLFASFYISYRDIFKPNELA